ncbi:MAG TPA: TldD/PmbA family protein [Anaerolineae bacterium]|nr:TldD/PmbA family protein [Anaerolineae bacterium]
MKDLSARVLNMAQMRGAAYADVRVVTRTIQIIAVKDGRVNELIQTESQGFGVRVIADGAWGFAASSRDDYNDVDATVNRALQIARASALIRKRDVRLGLPEANKGSFRSQYELDPFMVSMSDKINLLLKADSEMRRMKKNGAHLVTTAELVFVREDKTFASTEGALIQQEIVESGCEIQAQASNEAGDVQVRTYPWGRHQQTRGFEFILEQQLVENAPRIAEEATMLLGAEPCPAFDATTVILSSNQVALQVHESCGHPIELDRVLRQEASFAGTSFLTLEKLNNFQYGSEVVNLTADGTIPGGLGTFGYDDEGVPAQRIDVVKDGRFVGYMTNRELADELGFGRSNGTMRAESWNHIPLIRMTNINLLPGAWKLDDLIADTDEGIYFDTNRSWSIDDKRLNFQFGCELAWEIRGGKKTRLLKNPIYTGVTPTFWRSCDAICDESSWVVWGTPRCGKGQPRQTIRTGHGASPARFRNVRVFSRS